MTVTEVTSDDPGHPSETLRVIDEVPAFLGVIWAVSPVKDNERWLTSEAVQRHVFAATVTESAQLRVNG
jgi:hypothetical protein